MHGHGKMAAAPASDTAMHKGRYCLCVEPRLFFFRDTCRLAPICANASRIGLYRPNIGVFRSEKRNQPVRGKKKKKTLNRKYRWILIQDSHCRRHNFTGLNPFFHCFFVLFFLGLFCFFFFISFFFFFFL